MIGGNRSDTGLVMRKGTTVSVSAATQTTGIRRRAIKMYPQLSLLCAVAPQFAWIQCVLFIVTDIFYKNLCAQILGAYIII